MLTACGQLSIPSQEDWSVGKTQKSDWSVLTSDRPYVFSLIPEAGSLAGGTTLTIVGMNFVSTSTVTLGNSPCPNTKVVDSEVITCTLPSNPVGAYSIVVSNKDGTRDSNNHINYSYQNPIAISCKISWSQSKGSVTFLYLDGASDPINNWSIVIEVYQGDRITLNI